MNAEDLISAATGGSERRIRKVLKAGVDIDSAGHHNRWTALHWAVHAGTGAAVDLLLAAGADPNVAGSVGDTPLHVAVASAPVNPGVISSLLAAGADSSRENNYGISALEFARSIDGFPAQLLEGSAG